MPSTTLRFPVIMLILALGAPAAASAQTAEAAAARKGRVETQTLDLVRQHLEYGAADARARDHHARRVQAAAEARAADMRTLIASDPAAALRVAVPADLRNELPPEAQPWVESYVALDGEVEVVSEDFPWGARIRHYLHARDGRRRTVHFASDPPDLQSGDRIHLEGVELFDGVAADGASVQPVTTALSNTFGEQTALWILVNFQDKVEQPYTVAAAKTLLTSTVSTFYKENSQGQTWITGDVAGWFTIPMSSSLCDSYQLRTLAKQAAEQAGFDTTRYRRLIYGFPTNACAWWGLGMVGGDPSYAMINGSIALRVVGHELGHNLGLYHAHALECGTTELGSGCTTVDYGDPADIMGISGVVGHFNAYAKERLGWLNFGHSFPMLTVNGSGTYTFDPYASTSVGPKALKVLKDIDPETGLRTHFYIEYRRGINADSAFATNTSLANGVVVHTGNESNTNSSYVLDMTPETPSWTDAALPVGRSFTDGVSGVSITPVSVDSSGATVNVEVGVSRCVAQTPAVMFTPTATQWALPGRTVGWTMTVTNRNSEGCTPSTFAVSGQAPAGWLTTVAQPLLVAAPGETVATTFSVTSPANAPDGFHAVTGIATGDLAGSAAVTYAVMSSFTVSAAPGSASYSRNQVATFSVSTLNAGSPQPSVPVRVVLTKPDGKTIVLSLTTSATGTGTVSYRIGKKDPVGTWQMQASGAYNGITATAAGTFTVR